jgi:ComF family protein
MKLAGQERPAYFLYRSLWYALDWLFPPTCGGCSEPGQRWCLPCQEKIARITGPVCDRCGDLLVNPEALHNQPGALLCPDCQTHPPVYQAIRSYGVFEGPLREAIHRLKYQRDIGLGEALSKHLIELYNELKWEIDLVMPVPLSAKRAKERGYNQSGLLAHPLAYAVHKPYQPGALQRNRDTLTQVGLSAIKRQQNVQGAFTAHVEKVSGKVVLVIDDVMTTGSTISACAQALRKAGASAVYGLTLARATQKVDADLQPTPSY